MPSLKNSGFTTIEKSNSYVLLELFSIIFALIIWFADSILSRVIKFYFELIN